MSVNIMNKEQLNYLGKVVNDKLSSKVDTVPGKALSTNDYTNEAATEVAKISNKIDKEDGKSLSTNDYDNAAAAEVAKVSLKVNSVNPTFTGTVTIPTPVSSSSNDTMASTAFVANSISNSFSKITSFEYEVMSDGNLPSTGRKGIIYLIPNNEDGLNMYDEYMWVNNKFEKFGTTDMNLSGYVQKSDKLTTEDVDNAFEAAGL